MSNNSNYVKRHFNDLVRDSDYESYRWGRNKATQEQYRELGLTISFHLSAISFREVLEIGPGPGTWTKLMIKKAKNITLVDISKEMLNQARKNLNNKKISYICSDFLKFNVGRKFDLIFSSRAIEYIQDTRKAIRKMKSLLKDKGRIIIITKNPARRWKKILFNKKLAPIHKHWIPIISIKKQLQEENFKNIKIYPAIFSISPLPNFFITRKLNNLMHRLFYRKTINPLIVPFLESYVISAEK